MNNIDIIKISRQFVENRLKNEGSGHDWWHIVRVYNNAVSISNNENNVNDLVVKLGALFHDIADHKFGYTNEDRKIIISNFFNELKVDKKIIDQIVYIANNISFKNGANKHEMLTIEGKIVQDADRLDAMGAIGIGRAFTYGGYKSRLMYNPSFKKTEDTVSHFYDKLLLLKDKMNTESGQKKALIRHKIMLEFLENFYQEWNSKI